MEVYLLFLPDLIVLSIVGTLIWRMVSFVRKERRELRAWRVKMRMIHGERFSRIEKAVFSQAWKQHKKDYGTNSAQTKSN